MNMLNLEEKGRSSLVDHIHAVSVCLKAYNPRIRLYEVDKDFLQGFIEYLGTRKTRVTKKAVGEEDNIRLLRVYTCSP